MTWGARGAGEREKAMSISAAGLTTEATAEEIMQPGVVTVSPELSISRFEEFLTGEEIGGAPVVDERGELRGIASKTDIVPFLTSDEHFVPNDVMNNFTVAEIMTREVVTVNSRDPASVIAGKMIDNCVHRVVVLDGENIRGILTTLDLLKLLI